MKKALMLLAMTTVGLGAMNAWAVDNRVQPGMSCQQISGGIVAIGWQASMENVSTTAHDDLQLSCPIVRDNQSATPSSITVNVINTNPAENACCQFYSVDPTSSNVYWGSAKVCTTGWSGTAQQLHPVASAAYALGSELLFCTVPPMSGGQFSQLVTYQVIE
jgi:hypothetical protein